MDAMLQMFLASPNMPFSVAFCIFMMLGLIEIATSGAADALFEGIFPDFDFDGPDLDVDVDVDVDMDVDTNVPFFTKFVGWIRVKNVPMLILLVVFLFIFSVSGYVVQGLFKSAFGAYMPALLASLPAFVVAYPVMKGLCTLLGRYVLEEYTSAVKTSSLVGRVGYITLGTAHIGTPAEARVDDRHGQSHYVYVEPKEDIELKRGQKIALVRKDGNIFKAVPFVEEEDETNI